MIQMLFDKERNVWMCTDTYTDSVCFGINPVCALEKYLGSIAGEYLKTKMAGDILDFDCGQEDAK